MSPEVRKRILTLPAAYVLWFFTFQIPVLDFWIRLTTSAFILLAIAIGLGRRELSLRPRALGIFVGLVSAVLLYLFFWSGYQVLKGLPQFAGQISSVYSLKSAEPISIIATLLLFPIGPTEEIYWRGFIQSSLRTRLSAPWSIFPTSVLYSTIHLPTLNPSLMLTAFIGGLVWGYVFHRFGLVAAIVSHTLWDEMIFVFFVIS